MTGAIDSAGTRRRPRVNLGILGSVRRRRDPGSADSSLPRGVVALLFTDLVDSTRMLQQLGDERFEAVRQRHFQLCRDAFDRFSGHEVKNLGDGFMVAFESPTSAVRAALAVQGAVGDHNRAHPDETLAIRIGLHVGEPLIDEDDYFGTPVVVASRLCGTAGAHEIRVTEAVTRLATIDDGVGLEPIGSVELKGFDHAVDVVRVHIGENGTPGANPTPEHPSDTSTLPTDPPTSSDSPPLSEDPPPDGAPDGDSAGDLGALDLFVGREEELSQLEAAHRRAHEGVSFALVSGEPGIGKSALIERFMAPVDRDAETHTLLAYCESELPAPFAPLARALDAALGAVPADRLRIQLAGWDHVVAELLPRAANRLKLAPARGAVDPAHATELLSDLIAAHANSAPAVIVLEDLQWADPGTMQVLRLLARRAAELRLLVVMSYTPDAIGPGHPAAPLLAQLRTQRGVERISLGGLDHDEVRDMLTSLAGHQLGPQELALGGQLATLTSGNPLFIAEALRAYLTSGELHRDDGLWHADVGPGGLQVPAALHDLVRQRTASLDQDVVEALRHASVLGQRFRADQLALVTDREFDEVLDSLEEALAAGIIREDADDFGRFLFTHALLRDALYGDLTDTRRRRLHQKAAQALTDLHVESMSADIARHLLRALPLVPAADAIDACRTAAADARARGGYATAVTLLRSALELADDDGTRLDLLLATGDAALHAGDERAARQLHEQAAELATATKQPIELGRAVLGMTGGDVVAFFLEQQVIDDELITWLRRALDALPGDDGELRARLLAGLAEALYFVAGSLPERQRLATEAEAMARRVGDPSTLARVLFRTSLATWTVDSLDDLVRSATEGLELSRSTSDPQLIGLGIVQRSTAQLLTGDFEGYRSSLDEGIELVGQSLPLPAYDAITHVGSALQAQLDGDFAQMTAHAIAAFDLFNEVGDRNSTIILGTQMGGVLWETGRMREGHAFATDMMKNFSHYHAWPAVLAITESDSGLTTPARERLYDLAADGFAKVERDYTYLSTLATMAIATDIIGDPALAAQLHQEFLDYPRRLIFSGGPTTFLGTTDYWAALLALQIDDPDAADHFARVALDDARDLGVVHMAARCELVAAIAAAQLGNHDRARDLLDSSEPVFERCGMRDEATRAMRCRERLGGRVLETESSPSYRLRDRARSGLSSRSRRLLARIVDRSDEESLLRRFGSTRVRGILLSSMARSYQPAVAGSLHADVMIGFRNSSSDPHALPEWWTIQIRDQRATARRGAHDNPTTVIEATTPDLIRLLAGHLDSVRAIMDQRVTVKGDPVLASRLSELFGGVPVAELLGSGG